MIYECMETLPSSFSNGLFTLRPIALDDIENIRIWRNDQKEVLRQETHLTQEDQLNYWKNSILPTFTEKEPDQLLFGLIDNHVNTLVAYGGLVHMNWGNRYAESSFLSTTDRTRDLRAYTTLFVNHLELLMMIASSLNLSWIYSETYSFRKHHIRILEDFGYQQYGHLNNSSDTKNASILHRFYLDK